MNRMTREELIETPEFLRLTDAQKLFVLTYVANGYDVVNATRTAHKCKNDKIAKVMSYSIMASEKVTAALAMHFGSDPIASFEADLRRAIKSKKLSKEKVAAYRLLAEVRGYVRSNAPGKFMGKKETIPTSAGAPAPATADDYNLGEFED